MDNIEGSKESIYTKTEAEEILGSMPEYEEHYKKLVFEVLDENIYMTNEDKANLVGLVGNIKQATELTLYAEKEDAENVSTQTESVLNALGLEYTKESSTSEYDNNYVEIEYYVAKTKEDVNRLRQLFKDCPEDQTGDVERELGRMLGYPETAIEYFIKRQNGEVPFNTDNGKYNFYVHSPENHEEECKQYEQKINHLFRKYCPSSAKEFLGTE